MFGSGVQFFHEKASMHFSNPRTQLLGLCESISPVVRLLDVTIALA